MHFVLKPSHFSLFCYSWNSLGFFSLLFFVYCNCLLIRIRRRIFGWFFIDVWLSMKHLPFYKHSESTNFVAWIRTSTRISNAIILIQRRRRRRKKHWNARIDTQTAKCAIYPMAWSKPLNINTFIEMWVRISAHISTSRSLSLYGIYMSASIRARIPTMVWAETRRAKFNERKISRRSVYVTQ